MPAFILRVVLLKAVKTARYTPLVMQSTREVENYLKIQLASQPDECFAVLFLTSQHRLIRSERLFRSTVNSSRVHVRVIARKASEHVAT